MRKITFIMTSLKLLVLLWLNAPQTIKAFANSRKRRLSASFRRRSICPASSETCIDNVSGTAQEKLRPPKVLQDLELGEHWRPFGSSAPVAIERVALEPDAFIIRNFLPHKEDRQALMDVSLQLGMNHAGTKAGHVVHRKNSYVTWIPSDIEEVKHFGSEVSSFMTQLASYLFFDESGLDLQPEDLQVVKYDEGGKFDFHHDGFGRAITVLTYLNGVAGTWFPFAVLSKEDSDEEGPPEMKLEGKGMADGKTPGKDGLWIVGSEVDRETLRYEGESSKSHVVCINPGDALVFYNYEWLDNRAAKGLSQINSQQGGGYIMDWKSVHAGMPTDREKWIATNWYTSSDISDCLLKK